MIGIFILGVSLLGSLAFAFGLKYLLFRYDKRIEYTPMNNNLEQNEILTEEVPPKYEDINLVN